MKLMRHGPKGSEQPALVDADGQLRDLSGVLADITAATLSPHGLKRLHELDPSTLPLIETPGRLAPPPGCPSPGRRLARWGCRRIVHP